MSDSLLDYLRTTTNRDGLANASTHGDRLVRLAVARNPHTPRIVLARLCGDSHPEVSTVAQMYLDGYIHTPPRR